MVFWAGWFIYFSLYFLSIQKAPEIPGIKPLYVSTGPHIIVKTILLLLVYATACYPIVSRIVPALIKNHYMEFTAGILIVLVWLTFSSHILYWQVFPLVNRILGDPSQASFSTRYWPAINLGMINGGKVIVMASTFVYIKYWWSKSQETERLLREKAQNEIQALRAQINPAFLTGTLDIVHDLAVAASEKASLVLTKLADLLSYALYECNTDHVPLWREINMMKDYMDIEKSRIGNMLEMELNISGDISGKTIAPFLFLPFIDSAVRQCSDHKDFAWLNMDLRLDKDELVMTLAYGRPQGLSDSQYNNTAVEMARKRLGILYPGKHEVKLTNEEEMGIIQLCIQLDNTPTSEKISDTAFSSSLI